MRGEYQMWYKIHFPAEGSPPHARGIHVPSRTAWKHMGITPACAGNTLVGVNIISTLWDHPRMRGEYFEFVFVDCCKSGSPPHARGILLHNSHPETTNGITPACAGNTPSWLHRSRPRRDHPRMRGEYASIPTPASLALGSPPHARGILGVGQKRDQTTGITPACAGNTLNLPAGVSYRWDHPRMRGEYERTTYYRSRRRGSPPHARGILVKEGRRLHHCGITPACAGNTNR